MMPELTAYHSDAEVAAVVAKFESCAFQAAEFNHARHLTVLVWYLSRLSFEDAFEAMRASILKFSRHHGKSGIYHQTITVFWVRLVHDYIHQRPAVAPLYVLANEVIERCSDKNLIFIYYSRDLLLSPEAKSGWIDPDLRPLCALAP